MSSSRSDSFVDLSNARVDDQRAAMERIQERGECPFCPENLAKEHKQPIITRGDHWLVTPSQWPYKNTRVHLLFIALQHFERLCDMPPEAKVELFELIDSVEREQNLVGMSIGIRSGDTDVTKATVRHIHAHLIVPNITDENNPDYEKVKFKMG